MNLQQLVHRIPHSGSGDADIAAITYDSRKAGPGSLFVCLVGAWMDGHTFAQSAYDNGCRAFLAQRDLGLPEDAAVVLTEDTRAALAVIAVDFYGDPAAQLHLIGITGTKGKTTTALLAASIFNEAGLPCGYIGSNGVSFAGQHFATANTTPESLELQRFFRMMVDAGVRYVVMEVSSQALAHHRVDGLPFEVVAFTNLSEDHIGAGEHPDFEDYKQAKRRLFTRYAARCMVYNADDPFADEMRAEFSGQLISYALDRPADYRAVDLARYRSASALGVQFTCRHAGAATPVQVLSPGAFSASDALCALALCGAFGIAVPQAAATLAHTTVEGRFEVVQGLPGRTFIVDYSHNGLALTSALKTLRAYAPHRLICVFGSVGGRTQLRRRELAEAASAYADYSILTADNPDHEDPADIAREIASHMAQGAPYAIIPDRAEAVQAAVDLAEEGDIVLFAGKGHENYQLVCGKKLPFVERELIRAACEAKLQHEQG